MAGQEVPAGGSAWVLAAALNGLPGRAEPARILNGTPRNCPAGAARAAWTRFKPDGPARGGAAFGRWSDADRSSSRVIVRAGETTRYKSSGLGAVQVYGTDEAWLTVDSAGVI